MTNTFNSSILEAEGDDGLNLRAEPLELELRDSFGPPSLSTDKVNSGPLKL